MNTIEMNAKTTKYCKNNELKNNELKNNELTNKGPESKGYRYRPVLYFAMAYLFTWIFWVPAIFLKGNELDVHTL